MSDLHLAAIALLTYFAMLYIEHEDSWKPAAQRSEHQKRRKP